MFEKPTPAQSGASMQANRFSLQIALRSMLLAFRLYFSVWNSGYSSSVFGYSSKSLE